MVAIRGCSHHNLCINFTFSRAFFGGYNMTAHFVAGAGSTTVNDLISLFKGMPILYSTRCARPVSAIVSCPDPTLKVRKGHPSLVPRPHPLPRRNGLVNQVEFLGLVHTFATVSPSNNQNILRPTRSKKVRTLEWRLTNFTVEREVLRNNLAISLVITTFGE